MIDERTEKLAKLCVKYSVNVKPREKVVIRANFAAAPLITEIYEECLLADAYPWLMPLPHDLDFPLFTHAKEHQLKFVSPFDKFIYENADVLITVACEPNPRRLTNIDPAKIRTQRSARSILNEVFDRRVAEGKLRWTLLPFPINDQAQEAAMSLSEYEDVTYNSCMVHKKNPVDEWEKIRKQQVGICHTLNETSKMQIRGEDTDLTLSVKGRKWINCYGNKNMPDGEVFTAPVENSANGRIRFTYPGIYAGKEVEDISLTFKNGKVTRATASKGQDLLRELLKIKGADRIGEIAIGTNYGITRFTKNILLDEKMGGTIHMALGNSYEEAGGKNKSAIHWDILKDMKKDGEIHLDNKPYYKNGKISK